MLTKIPADFTNDTLLGFKPQSCDCRPFISCEKI